MTPRPRTIADEHAYQRGMAWMLKERGFWNLARSHELQAELYQDEAGRSRNLAGCRQWDPEECAALVEARDAQVKRAA